MCESWLSRATHYTQRVIMGDKASLMGADVSKVSRSSRSRPLVTVAGRPAGRGRPDPCYPAFSAYASVGGVRSPSLCLRSHRGEASGGPLLRLYPAFSGRRKGCRLQGPLPAAEAPVGGGSASEIEKYDRIFWIMDKLTFLGQRQCNSFRMCGPLRCTLPDLLFASSDKTRENWRR